ncbi:MAG: hypothetical protein J1E80_00820 [Desulfovibrionaceae bacterium]|nr:hypothetical protein [Desulfovibrionaceae bacterium]
MSATYGKDAVCPVPTVARPGLRMAMCFAGASHETEDTAAQAWQDAARCLGAAVLPLEWKAEGKTEPAALIAGARGCDVLVVGGLEPGILTELAQLAPMPLVNAGNETARPCQVLADLLAVSLRRNPAAAPLKALRAGWLGDADGPSAGLFRSWLDAALCFHLEFFAGFPRGHEPDAEHLECAMSAGARIFLSHDPLPVVDGCHVLVAAPWNASASGLGARHPLLSDPELAQAAAGIPVCPFDAHISSEADGPWEAERKACLRACQAALIDMLCPPAEYSVNVQQGGADSAAARQP